MDDNVRDDYQSAEDLEDAWLLYWNEFTDQTRLNCPRIWKLCGRYGIRYRSAALLASVILYDVSKYIPEVKGLVFDKIKLYRERTKTRHQLQKEQLSLASRIKPFYFDGRKDETKVMCEKSKGKIRQTIKREERTSLIQEPGSTYLGHVSSSSSDAKTISHDILQFLLANKLIPPIYIVWVVMAVLRTLVNTQV